MTGWQLRRPAVAFSWVQAIIRALAQTPPTPPFNARRCQASPAQAAGRPRAGSGSLSQFGLSIVPMSTRNFPDRDQEQSPKGETPLPAVSANTLARILGVTPKVAYDLAKDRIIERGAGRLYRLRIVCGVTVITSASKRHDEARRMAMNFARTYGYRSGIKAPTM